MNKKILFFTILGYIYAPYTFAQNCNLNVSLSNFTATLNDSNQMLAHSFTISKSSNAPECAQYNAYFTKGSANSYQRRAFWNGVGLPYNLHPTINGGSILKDYGDALTGEYLTGNLTNNPTAKNWYISLPNLDSSFALPAGVYSDTWPIRIYSTSGNGTVRHELDRWITVSFTIPRYAHLSLVPENTPHNPNATVYVMDFEGMTTNKEMGVDLRVISNVGYGVNVNSLNNGRLIRGSQSVPYMINLGDGQWRSFQSSGNNWQMIQSQNRTQYEGARYNIRVRLGNVPTDLEGGDYQDTIIFTVQAW